MPTPIPVTNPITEHFLSLKLKDRSIFLSRLRESDPASALHLVQSIWRQSDAESRKTYIRTFHIGLSMADEPFLEAALDDRGRRVRGTAAYLLASISGSRLLQRFTAHAVNHLDYLIHMRPNTPDKLHVTLPTTYTSAMKRDGIFEKPYPPTISPSAYWLFQEIGHIPVQTWTQRWNKTPQQIINAALNSGEYSNPLLTAFINATHNYKDPDWAEAVLAHNFEDIVPVTPQYLLNLVSPDRREQIVQNNLANHPGLLHAPGTPIYMLWHLEIPWSPSFSQFVLNRLAHYLNPSTPEDPKIRDAMDVIANALSLSTADQAETLLNPNQPINPYYASQVANLLQILCSRRAATEVKQ